MLDPSKGDGSFYDQLEGCKDWCEISEGKDFFEYTKKVDWIITNPPWSLMRKFLQHGMDLADNIVYLTTFNHYTTKARLRDMYESGFGLKEVLFVDAPKSFPQSGFELAAVHTQRGYEGSLVLNRSLKYPECKS